MVARETNKSEDVTDHPDPHATAYLDIAKTVRVNLKARKRRETVAASAAPEVASDRQITIGGIRRDQGALQG